LSIAFPLCQPIGLAGSITGDTSVLFSKTALVNNKSIVPYSGTGAVVVSSDVESFNCGSASTFVIEKTSLVLSLALEDVVENSADIGAKDESGSCLVIRLAARWRMGDKTISAEWRE
jgi:hypothetical protein